MAPHLVGFGFTDRPGDVSYGLQTWADQVVALMDALGLQSASLVGNSFGGSIALRIATQHPKRVDKLVLMGSMGLEFPLTEGEGLDRVWGYTPSFENMRRVLDVFAHSRELVNGDLHVFANCGHWSQIERSADFNRLVHDFFSDTVN